MNPAGFGRRSQIGRNSIDLVGFGFAAAAGLQPVAAGFVAVAGMSDPDRWFGPCWNDIGHRRTCGRILDGRDHRRLANPIHHYPSEARNQYQEPWQQPCDCVLQTLTCSSGWCAGT